MHLNSLKDFAPFYSSCAINMAENTELECGGSIEWLNSNQMVNKQVKVKSMSMVILRNEFREIYVVIKAQNKVNLKLPLIEVNIHKKFVVEGKATLHFTKDNVRVMIYNAPPSMLMAFLKTLFVKLTSRKNSPKINTREQLLSKKPQSFGKYDWYTLDQEDPVIIKYAIFCDYFNVDSYWNEKAL